ncbi:MAG: hydroxymethylbilane synthase [bacterium]
MRLRIATRGSDLALWQAHTVAGLLQALGAETSVETLSTRGDRETGAPLFALGATGLFTAEVDRALIEKRAEVAVHSLKDLPLKSPRGLTLVAIPERGPTEDLLVTTNGEPLAQLRQGARVGTSSPRRAGYLRATRPDLEIVTLRGNVPTRVKRVLDGEVDATVLARAGVDRLEIPLEHTEVLPLLPAPGQGALGIVVRSDDEDVLRFVRQLDHEETRAEVTAERAVLGGLGGGCSLPLGARARRLDGEWNVAAELWGEHGEHAFDERQGKDWIALAAEIATTLHASGVAPERES